MMQNQYQNLIQSSLNDAIEVKTKVTGWKELKKGKILTISNVQYKDNALKLNKIEGTIPANFQKVIYYYFNNLEAQKACRQEMLTEMKVIENLDENTYIQFQKTKSKLVVSSRESLTVTRKIQLNPNECVIIKSHLSQHPGIVISKDSVQTETKLFALFLTKVDENKTKIESIYLVDPKGSIPTSITNNFVELSLKAYEKDIEAILKS